MTTHDQKRLDREFEIFTKRNFQKPAKCKNEEELRFYIREISLEIEHYKRKHNYVPSAAYQLLAQYNRLLNRIVFTHFKNAY